MEMVRGIFSRKLPNEIHFLKTKGLMAVLCAHTLTVLGLCSLAGNLNILANGQWVLLSVLFFIFGAQMAALAAALSTIFWLMLLAYSSPDTFYFLSHETSALNQIWPFILFIFVAIKIVIFEWLLKQHIAYRRYQEDYITKLLLFLICSSVIVIFITKGLNHFLQRQVPPSQVSLIERDVDINFSYINSRGTTYFVHAQKIKNRKDIHYAYPKREGLEQMYQYKGRLRFFDFLDDSYNSIYHLATEDGNISFLGLCNYKMQCVRITEQYWPMNTN